MTKTPEIAECVVCGSKTKIVTSPDMQERDELIYSLQLAAARSQDFDKGWVCTTKPCLKIAAVNYKIVAEIMKDLPDCMFRARKDTKVTVM